MAARRSGFGSVRKLTSGRWQARYVQPGTDRSVTAPTTFATKTEATTWLSTVRADLARGEWLPTTRDVPLRDYAGQWLEHREVRPRTRQHYTMLLDRFILPALGDIGLRALSPAAVRKWHQGLDASTPTQRSHAYALLSAVCKTAVSEDVIAANPCRVRGAGQVKRATSTDVLDLDELAALVAAMPERLRLATVVAAHTGLRFGEQFELRAGDVDLKRGLIRVRRGVVRVDGKTIVGPPKTAAGVRDVHIAGRLLDDLRDYVRGLAPDALLWPSATDPTKHLAPASLYGAASTPTKPGWGFYGARETIGRKDVRWHDLRHLGATLAASTGASLAELMERLGHATPTASLRYQHAARARGPEIAALLAKLADPLQNPA